MKNPWYLQKAFKLYTLLVVIFFLPQGTVFLWNSLNHKYNSHSLHFIDWNYRKENYDAARF